MKRFFPFQKKKEYQNYQGEGLNCICLCTLNFRDNVGYENVDLGFSGGLVEGGMGSKKEVVCHHNCKCAWWNWTNF